MLRIVFGTAVCLSMLMIDAAPAEELGDEGLVAWWTFEAGAGDVCRDRTDNNNNGLLRGGPTWVADGIDGAMQFDGIDDYIDCGDLEILDLDQRVTL